MVRKATCMTLYGVDREGGEYFVFIGRPFFCWFVGGSELVPRGVSRIKNRYVVDMIPAEVEDENHFVHTKSR